MYVCGICHKSVNHLNNFHDYIGRPPVPIYKIIRICTRGSNCKTIDEGVCNICTKDLESYHDAVVAAKHIKQRLLGLINNKQIKQFEKSSVANTCELKYNGLSKDDEKIKTNLNGPQSSEKKDNYDLNIVNDNVSEAVIIDNKKSKKPPLPSNKCEECGEVFADRISCKIHKEQNHVKGFICELCGKVVKTQKSLKDHKFLHGTEKPFKCHICDERFHFELRLKVHLTRHTGEKPYKCETCGKCFRHKTNLSGHKNSHTDVPLLYECKICNKGFQNRSRLKNHEVKHSTEKKYFCKYCNRGFTTKYYIPQHLKENKKCAEALQNDSEADVNNSWHPYADRSIKIPVKPIPNKRECNICGKTFLKSSGLSTHMYTHAKEKEHKCPHCKYCTANKSALVWHLKNNKKCSASKQNDELEK